MRYDKERIDRWDEAIPLGNGNMGGLLFGGGKEIYLNIDSSLLWDMRQEERTKRESFNFKEFLRLIQEGEEKNAELQNRFGRFYEDCPFPTKIPAGRIVFKISGGECESFFFSMNEARGGAILSTGEKIECFFSANDFLGYIKYPKNVKLVFAPPKYTEEKEESAEIPTDSLLLLGYPKGSSIDNGDTFIYRQPMTVGEYSVIMKTKETDSCNETVFMIKAQNDSRANAELLDILEATAISGYDAELSKHKKWWNEYYSRSYVNLPKSQNHISELYDFANYFMGSASRSGFPPIALQGVWTAAEDKLPPWKGDYHFDLNVQGTYNWAFRAGRLECIAPLIEYFEKTKENIELFSERFFGIKDVFFIPGTADLDGNVMGGWVQYTYSFGSSIWMILLLDKWYDITGDDRYKKDFLLPVLKKTYNLLKNVFLCERNGGYDLIISVSPEINDNKHTAWVKNSTYDISLIKAFLNTFINRLSEEGESAAEQKEVLLKLPKEKIDENGYLLAEDMPLTVSHRHHAHCMNIYPLCQLDYLNDSDKDLMDKTIQRLEELGTMEWTGFAFPWMASLGAMAQNANLALKYLNIFASAFISDNGFHLNGDYKRLGYSHFTYRPFTLEANGMLAEAVEEMLMQYHHDILRLFPSIPKEWSTDEGCEFKGFKINAFITVSAKLKNGEIECEIENLSEDTTIKIACFNEIKSINLKAGNNKLYFKESAL